MSEKQHFNLQLLGAEIPVRWFYLQARRCIDRKNPNRFDRSFEIQELTYEAICIALARHKTCCAGGLYPLKDKPPAYQMTSVYHFVLQAERRGRSRTCKETLSVTELESA